MKDCKSYSVCIRRWSIPCVKFAWRLRWFSTHLKIVFRFKCVYFISIYPQARARGSIQKKGQAQVQTIIINTHAVATTRNSKHSFLCVHCRYKPVADDCCMHASKPRCLVCQLVNLLWPYGKTCYFVVRVMACRLSFLSIPVSKFRIRKECSNIFSRNSLENVARRGVHFV